MADRYCAGCGGGIGKFRGVRLFNFNGLVRYFCNVDCFWQWAEKEHARYYRNRGE